MSSADTTVAGRICSRCKEWRAAKHFSRDRRHSTGLFRRCKVCDREHYLENREQRLEQQRRRRRENPERHRARMRRYAAAHREEARAAARKSNLKNKYGLTVEQYDELMTRPCAICGVDAERKHLDHDHATGAVRNVLCQPCNHMLGNATDLPERLEAGAAYLRRYAAKQNGAP